MKTFNDKEKISYFENEIKKLISRLKSEDFKKSGNAIACSEILGNICYLEHRIAFLKARNAAALFAQILKDL